MEKRDLAVFDIDGTLFRSSLVVELVYIMIAVGLFPKRLGKELERDYLAWVNRKASYGNFIAQVVGIYFNNIKGCKKADIDIISDRIIDEHKDKVYQFTLRLAKELKRRNFFLIAISGSPVDIVSKFASYFGFGKSFGNEFEIDASGVFTGRLVDCDITKCKEKVLKNFLEDRREIVDLKNMIVIGDTEIDIPILEMAAYPIAFNPNKGLAEYAKQKKWRVVVERKDVIYGINEFDILKEINELKKDNFLEAKDVYKK